MAPAFFFCVVGVVEAGALEVDRDGVQDALGGGAALLALGERLVAILWITSKTWPLAHLYS